MRKMIVIFDYSFFIKNKQSPQQQQFPMQPNVDKALKNIFKSSLGASYFHGFQNNKFTQQSRIDSLKVAEEEEVDADTFRIVRGFVRPDDNYAVYAKTGLFHVETQGFFACFSARKRMEVQLKNFTLSVKDQDTVKKSFNFETESCGVTSKGDHFTLNVDSCSQDFYFEPVEHGKKQQLVDDWVGLISKVINTSDGKKHRYNYLPAKDPLFYKQLHISNQQFEKSANSLDVVLFKSPHSAAAVQRLFTNSEYDHVGIVLRNKKNQLFIFESTSPDGVGLTPWKDMIRFQWHKSTDKIAWRRLIYPFSLYDADHAQAFVAKHLGKEYEITLEKLFMFSSTLKKSAQDEKKTFFCSELAARLYKQLGLLDQKKASASYYPVDFSEKGGMRLLKDARLDTERVIAFNGH